MLDIPDHLEILTNPLRVEPGRTASLRLAINAKNDFLPKHADALSVVIGTELKDAVLLVSKGRLIGGEVRLTVQAEPGALDGAAKLMVALVDPALPVFLIAEGVVEVHTPKKKGEPDRQGGEPDVEINWVSREAWANFEPPWDTQVAGECNVTRDTADPTRVIRVDWTLNEAFVPYAAVVNAKALGAESLKVFQESYELPVCWGFFSQAVAEWERERAADSDGNAVEVPDDYARGERSRLARAVLIAKEPDIVAAASDD
jgi:hypothetical protein